MNDKWANLLIFVLKDEKYSKRFINYISIQEKKSNDIIYIGNAILDFKKKES